MLNLAVSPYTLDDFPLGTVATQKDLGVTVTNTLTWGFHISSVVEKAKSKFGFLRRHFSSACLGADRKSLLVRSQLGYAREVCTPKSCSRDLKLLEGVKRRATLVNSLSSLTKLTKSFQLNYFVSCDHLG